jgi:hypothetical protein
VLLAPPGSASCSASASSSSSSSSSCLLTLRLPAERKKREAEQALFRKAKSTVAWQLLDAEIAEARAQIERKHALRKSAKSLARVRDECNVEVARARYEISQRHFRLWEQRGLPLSRLFPSDGREIE